MRFGLRPLLLAPLVLSAMMMIIGRIPRFGTIDVLEPNSFRVEVILVKHRVLNWTGNSATGNWTGNSATGGMTYALNSGFTLSRLENYLLADADDHGYWLRIRYHCVFSVFDSEVIVNEHG